MEFTPRTLSEAFDEVVEAFGGGGFAVGIHEAHEFGLPLAAFVGLDAALGGKGQLQLGAKAGLRPLGRVFGEEYKGGSGSGRIGRGCRLRWGAEEIREV